MLPAYRVVLKPQEAVSPWLKRGLPPLGCYSNGGTSSQETHKLGRLVVATEFLSFSMSRVGLRKPSLAKLS